MQEKSKPNTMIEFDNPLQNSSYNFSFPEINHNIYYHRILTYFPCASSMVKI